jgi:hypothetical protein
MAAKEQPVRHYPTRRALLAGGARLAIAAADLARNSVQGRVPALRHVPVMISCGAG